MVRGARGAGANGAAAGRAQRAPDARLQGLGAALSEPAAALPRSAVPMGLPPAARYFRFLLRGRRRDPRSAAGLRGLSAARRAAGGPPEEEASPLRHGAGSRTESRGRTERADSGRRGSLERGLHRAPVTRPAPGARPGTEGWTLAVRVERAAHSREGNRGGSEKKKKNSKQRCRGGAAASGGCRALSTGGARRRDCPGAPAQVRAGWAAAVGVEERSDGFTRTAVVPLDVGNPEGLSGSSEWQRKA